MAAIQLVMMQASTSLIFSSALTKPGIAPQAAPARIPLRNASSHTNGAGTTAVGMLNATISVAAVLIKYCPGAPILKRPVLNATATDSPVRINNHDNTAYQQTNEDGDQRGYHSFCPILFHQG